jgi:NAD-dependent deacetylase
MALAPDLVARLSQVEPRRLLIATGAGISAESGIPTYRGENGLWRQQNFEQMATRSAFERDAERIWSWYRERRQAALNAKPNAAHRAVVELAKRAPEALVVTQNVDDLHERAGLPLELLVHIHGRILETRCENCGLVAQAAADDGTRPCPRCNRFELRPNVVWFDEELPEEEVRRVERFLAQGACGLVLIVGTTAVFDYIRDWIARGAGSVGLIVDVNPDASRISETFARHTWHVQANAGQALPQIARCLAKSLSQ